jgi:hypothetical protein
MHLELFCEGECEGNIFQVHITGFTVIDPFRVPGLVNEGTDTKIILGDEQTSPPTSDY